jgi:Predicted acetyltransferase
MNLTESIIKTEQEFPGIFTNTLEKEYGLLFFNEENRISHDSNHAIIYPEKISDIEGVITEIKDFYLKKGLVPRIYHPFKGGYFEEHRAIFEKHGFIIQKYGFNRFMVLEQDNRIKVNGNLIIKRITEWDDRIETDIYAPEDDVFTPIVIRNCLKDENYCCFVGYMDGKAVSTASIYYSKYGCARIDSVETAQADRRKGYSREIISYAIEYHKQHSKNVPLFLWPANETADKIYTEAGFRQLFQSEAGEAVFEEK